MENKKIICSPQYGLAPDASGGGEVHDEAILKGLANLGWQIEIILPHNRPYDTAQKNWNVYQLPLPYIHSSYLFNLAIIPYLIRTYRRTHFKILRVHSPYYVGIGAWIFKKIFAPEIKLITTYHHLENNFIFKIIDRLFIKQWDKIITVSQTSRNALIESYRLPENKISVIYNGIAKRFHPSNQAPKKDVFTVSFCGCLIPRKNIPFLIEAIKETNDDKIHLIIAGKGPQKKYLEEKVRSLNMEKKVTITGYVSEEEKIRIFQSSDVFAFPSLMEGFGFNPIEAMACGAAVISSDKGALPEVIGNGGIILPLEKEMWSAKIAELKSNPEYLKEISSKGLERVKIFNWDEVANATSNIMNEFRLQK